MPPGQLTMPLVHPLAVSVTDTPAHTEAELTTVNVSEAAPANSTAPISTRWYASPTPTIRALPAKSSAGKFVAE